MVEVPAHLSPSLSLSVPASCPAMTWTTLEEFNWLFKHMPEWNRRCSEKGNKFLTTTTAEFLEVFPSSLPIGKV